MPPHGKAIFCYGHYDETDTNHFDYFNLRLFDTTRIERNFN